MGTDQEYLLSTVKLLLDNVLQYYSFNTERIELPRTDGIGYPDETITDRDEYDLQAETFVRTFMVAVPLLVREPSYKVTAEKIPVNDFFQDRIHSYLSPISRNYIQPPTSLEYSQITVEAGLLAACLLETKLMDNAPSKDRRLIIRWFESLVDVPVYNNNWIWFKVMVLVFLSKYLFDVEDKILDCLSQIREMYVGEGWFKDGNKYDLYCAWSMQFWPPLLLKHYPHLSPETIAFFNEANDKFLNSYSYFFSKEGKSLPWGRSKIYRFAASSPYAVAFNRPTLKFNPGFARHLVINNIKSFLNTLGVINSNGLLSLGFTKEDKNVVDTYSCVASPMWAAKSFWCLNLPDDNPFWSAPLNKGFWGQSTGIVPKLPDPNMKLTIEGSDITLDFPQEVKYNNIIDLRYVGPFSTNW